MGLDVLDFRDGQSRAIFSQRGTIEPIVKKLGGVVVAHKSDITASLDLLAGLKEGGEGYFATGRHAAIVRRKGGILEYLELQSVSHNGFQELTREKLKYRFAAQSRKKYTATTMFVSVDDARERKNFRELLSYLNTSAGEQKKGAKGSTK